MVLKIADQKKELDSPAFKSATWNELNDAWEVVQDLWQNPLKIRRLGKKYLDKFNQEPEDKFTFRVKQSVFENDFKLAIETMAGMVFRNNPAPQDLVTELDQIITDVDLRGNSFWAFCVSAFAKFLRDGNGYIMIDSPPLSDEMQAKIANGVSITKQDRKNDRPWWVFYEANQLINHRIERIDNEEKFVQATFIEKMMKPAGKFGESEVIYHKVCTPGKIDIYRVDDKEELILDKSIATNLDFVPIIPLSEIGTEPFLLELAMLCVQMYNKKSDLDNITHLVCTPLLLQTFDSEQDAKAAKALHTASPGVGRKVWGEHADMKYVEVSGSGLDFARQRVKDGEDKIAVVGAGMVAPSDVIQTRTATEVADTAGQRQSKLSFLAHIFANSLEKLLYMTAEYINEIQGKNTINLNEAEAKTRLKLKIDFGRLTFSLEQMRFFSDLVDRGVLTKETYLKWLSGQVDFPEGFDLDEELEALKKENTLIFTKDEETGNELPSS